MTDYTEIINRLAIEAKKISDPEIAMRMQALVDSLKSIDDSQSFPAELSFYLEEENQSKPVPRPNTFN